VLGRDRLYQKSAPGIGKLDDIFHPLRLTPRAVQASVANEAADAFLFIRNAAQDLGDNSLDVLTRLMQNPDDPELVARYGRWLTSCRSSGRSG